ncbi:polysaccharide biosynthesis protein [Bacillus sp. 165]|uniref:putative polysaccharide biosynthesis protein n=1 Tax=Bacillus sp. 165 TaxID=1529117 RepID=UPI001ADBB38C|nr:polysaccharide biosynthesis protein [Bacillus sp. 165]MBO9131306.1 polysaccharide biosynthesis protein [Bacillus sp. 165]
MEAKKDSAFWRGAIILTAASIIVKILSAFYRIPYQNIVGDVGFYIYQQVYPFYGICLILSVYGFPIIISKMIAEHREKGEYTQANEVIFVSFWFLTILGCIAFLSLYLGAPFIAGAMGDSGLVKLLRMVSFSYLFMPFISVVRGYFQGLEEMLPTAISQIIEQSVRVIVIVSVSILFVSQGFDLYDVGTGAVFGAVAGAVGSIIVLAFFMRPHMQATLLRRWKNAFAKRTIVKVVFWQGIFICITNLVLILIQLIDSVSLYSFLLQAGENAHEAKVIKGVYDRAIPLMQLGTIVATSFSLSLIPIITTAIQRKNGSFIKEKVNLAMKITLVIGLAATAGLVCIVRPVNIMLFENADGSNVIAILALSIVFSAISITTASILQGMGKMLEPAFFVIGGIFVKYGGNALLIPFMGIKGAAIATVLALAIIALVNSVYLYSVLGDTIVKRKNVRHIIICNFLMVAALLLYIKAVEGIFIVESFSRSIFAVEALTSVIVGGIVYLFFIFKLNVFTEEELGNVFKNKRINAFLKKI